MTVAAGARGLRASDLEGPSGARACRDLIASAMRRQLGSRRTLLVTVAVPDPASLYGLLDLLPHGSAWLWQPQALSSEPAVAAIGEVHALRAEGAARFSDLRRGIERLRPRLYSTAMPGLAPPAPRLYGGFAFAPGTADADLWRGFGDTLFALPRLVLRRGPVGATLTAALACDDRHAAASLDDLLEDVGKIARWLERGGGAIAPGTEPPHLDACPTNRDRRGIDPSVPGYRRQVAAITAAIRRTGLQKVVAARRVETEVGSTAPSRLLARLDAIDDATRFVVRRPDGSTFLGATPERLVRRAGSRVDSEALAGSIDRRSLDAGGKLLASLKDRGEHRLVVQHLVERLRPLCSLLEWDQDPRPHAAGRLLHLRTAVAGRLGSGADVLDLVAALHPTPAVCGTPSARALHWILDHEPHARGWYASPVGWMDFEGNGDFRVALRCALRRGRRAWMWAGAGIVAGSEPELELRETELKLRAMREVLAPVPRLVERPTPPGPPPQRPSGLEPAPGRQPAGGTDRGRGDHPAGESNDQALSRQMVKFRTAAKATQPT